jgi:RNA polymerase sigma-70 factor (ECF subfamily)
VQDEENLAHPAQQRDPEAFSQLYDKHFDRIYRYIAFRVGNQTEAEDLTQQVFLKAWESIGSYKWKGLPFSSWLFRIAHNQLVDCLRKKNKRKETPLEEAQAVSATDLISAVERKLTSEQVASACRHLKEAQQEVISLRFSGGLSTAEVAKIMDKTEGAVKALQHSALKSLRAILGQEAE